MIFDLMGNSRSTSNYCRLRLSSDSLTRPLLAHDNKSIQQQKQLEIEVNHEKSKYLEKTIKDIESSISKLQEVALSIRKQEKDIIETINNKNSSLEKKVLELTSTIDDIKRSRTCVNVVIPVNPQADVFRNPIIPDLMDMEPAATAASSTTTSVPMSKDVVTTTNSNINPDNRLVSMVSGSEFYDVNNLLNDLTGCVVVLIFLVALLIGIQL